MVVFNTYTKEGAEPIKRKFHEPSYCAKMFLSLQHLRSRGDGYKLTERVAIPDSVINFIIKWKEKNDAV